LAKSAGISSRSSTGSTSAGSASCSSGGRDSTSSGSSRSDGNIFTAAAADTTADAALLQQLQLQLQYETGSSSTQPSADAEADNDAVRSSVQALLSCLSLEASLGQVNEAGLTGAESQHDAPETTAAAAAPSCKMQHGVQLEHCMPTGDGFAACGRAPESAVLGEQQPVQQWQAVATDAGNCSSVDSSVHVPGMGGSLWGGAAAPAAPGAGTLLPAAAVAAGFTPGSILQDRPSCSRNSSSNALLASSGSQQSLTGQSLTQSTAVDPADSVLDDVAPLGLFGAVQPRTSSKQQQ
jgi:hypothetical protein